MTGTDQNGAQKRAKTRRTSEQDKADHQTIVEMAKQGINPREMQCRLHLSENKVFSELYTAQRDGEFESLPKCPSYGVIMVHSLQPKDRKELESIFGKELPEEALLRITPESKGTLVGKIEIVDPSDPLPGQPQNDSSELLGVTASQEALPAAVNPTGDRSPNSLNTEVMSNESGSE